MKPIPHELAALCSGLVLGRIFPMGPTSHDDLSLPSLSEVLARPGIAHEPFAHMGVDSLAWLGLITTLESEWGLDLGGDFLVNEHVTAWTIGEALARALTKQVA